MAFHSVVLQLDILCLCIMGYVLLRVVRRGDLQARQIRLRNMLAWHIAAVISLVPSNLGISSELSSPGEATLAMAVSLASVALIVMAARSWFVLLAYYLDIADEVRARAVFVANAVAAVLVVFAAASPVTHLFFYIEGSHLVVHGALNVFVHAILVVELVFAVASALWARAKMARVGWLRVGLLSFYPVALIVFAVLGAPLSGVSYLAPGATFAVVVIYMGYLDTLISTDPLTGVNNRYRLFDYVKSRMEDAEGDLCLFMIDVNGFKSINDTYGHLEGDRALRVVAQGLKRALMDAPSAFLARYGGDEFTVVIHIEESAEDEFSARVRESVARAAREAGVAYPLSVSVGVARMRPGIDEPAELFAAADAQLYKAKRASRMGQADEEEHGSDE